MDKEEEKLDKERMLFTAAGDLYFHIAKAIVDIKHDGELDAMTNAHHAAAMALAAHIYEVDQEALMDHMAMEQVSDKLNDEPEEPPHHDNLNDMMNELLASMASVQGT